MSSTVADDEPAKYPHWQRNLQVISVSNLLGALGFNLSWPFVPLMVRELGVHENLETWLGCMLLAFYIVSFIFNPIWGGIADFYGRKLMVLRSMGGMGCMLLLVGFAPTPMWFGCLFMLAGIFNGFTPAAVSLLLANTPPRRIGSVVSIAQTGGFLGQALGPVLGAMLATIVDHQRWLLWVSGGFLLSGTLLVGFFVREVKQLASGPWRLQWMGNLREVVVIPRIAPLFGLGFLFSVMSYGSVTNITVFVLQLLEPMNPDSEVKTFWVGAVGITMACSMMIAQPFWGQVIDRIGPSRVLTFTTAATVITHLPLLVLQTPVQLVIARLAFGLSGAAMPTAITQLIREYSPVGMDARAMSYGTAFQFIAMGLAPFAAGLISPRFGMRTYFGLTTLFLFLGLMLWMQMQKRQTKKCYLGTCEE